MGNGRFSSNQSCIRRGADRFLARPTSRCRRTESIVSLEREVCSCAELQVFSCYRCCKEACQATRAIFNNIETRAVIKFFFLARQGGEGNLRHSDRNVRRIWTIVCDRQKLGGPVFDGGVSAPPRTMFNTDTPSLLKDDGKYKTFHDANTIINTSEELE